jgi:hypothetical protein
MRAIQIGDKVAYSVQWLRSTGQVAGDAGHARGIVESLDTFSTGFTLARVKWDCDMPDRVNVKNLAVVGLNTKFVAC